MFRLSRNFVFFFLLAPPCLARLDSLILVSSFPANDAVFTNLFAKNPERDSFELNIKTELAHSGYFAPAVSVAEQYTADSVRVVVAKISYGPRGILRGIVVHCANQKDSAFAGAYFAPLLQGYYSAPSVEYAIRELLGYYQLNGFPFAAVMIRHLSYSEADSSVILSIHVDKGVFSTFDGYRIGGNERTKEYVLIRQLRIVPGSPYDRRVLNDIPQKLMRTRLFSYVSPAGFAFDKEKRGIILFDVKEKNAGTVDGIIGYVPESSNQSGYFTGMVNLTAGNLFGTGRAASVRWQKTDRKSSELELRYLEPWIAGYPFSAEGHFFQREQDSSFVQRVLNGSIDYYATSDFSIGLLFGYQRVIPAAERTMAVVSNSTSFSTGIKVMADTRDDPLFPREGFHFVNTLSVISKSSVLSNSPKKDVVQQQMFSFDLGYYLSFITNQVIAVGLHGREHRGSKVELSEYSRFGGYSTIRGYREQQFAAPRVLFSNLEYRLFTDRRSFLYLFFDAAYFKVPGNTLTFTPTYEMTKTGYGLGMKLESGLGVLNVSFALSPGDTFAEGKIHFGVSNEF